MTPTFRLHKLPQGYVLTSDEDICSGDLFLVGSEIEQCLSSAEADNLSIGESYPKVVAQDFDFSSLSPEEQKEIGWFDVEKLADDYSVEVYPINGQDREAVDWIESQKILIQTGFEAGFQKAQELLGGFTLEDMENAFYNGWIYRGEGHDFPRAKKEYLQQLSQPKSWEVEAEVTNGKAKIIRIS
jgi:hypothetical protein